MSVKKYSNYLSFLIIFFTMMPICQATSNGVIHDNYTIDVYKTDKITAQEVDKLYGKQLNEIATSLLAAHAMPTQESAKGLENAFNTILTGIQEKGDFAYLGMTPVVYPGKNYIGISIDVVDQADRYRLEGMLPKPTKSYPDPGGLLASWQSYEDFGSKHLFLTKPPTVEECPAFHCVFGFTDPNVKKYATLFNTKVPKYKSELINILRNDKDERKRATAAFLLAHIKDGNELIKILVPSMRDSSGGVRNNVMRVLLQTLMVVKDAEFPVSEAVRALSYPFTTDRNKDIYLLKSLSANPRYTKYIKEHACHGLMEQYRLAQFNLHDSAYQVLQNISGKNYSREDAASWEDWALRNCPRQNKA